MHNRSFEQTRTRIIEIGLRFLCVCFYTYFTYSVLTAFMAARNLPALLLLCAESLTILLIVTARFSTSSNRSLYVSTITVAAMFYLVLVDLSDGTRLLPVSVTACLQIGGILVQIYAKLYLGRSFGLLPANRGIVQTGPYRIVRHPIYFGYFLGHLGFLLSVWSLHNVGVFAFLYILQFLRIHEEEKLLLRDPEYQGYTRAVPHRFIPLVY